MGKIRWGVLSTAKIATEKVIPAMQRGQYSEVVAIASREAAQAAAAAAQLGLGTAYGSYEQLLADKEIDAVYNPLPNHLHVPWSIKALAAGKHVLCEKPIALSVAEAEELVTAAGKHPDLKVMEAFMYRHHPQWQRAREIVTTGQIGRLRTIQSFFSYFNNDPNNIRNIAEIGGGGLMDIGCYCISLARFLFASEPQRVCGLVERDPLLHVDCVTSGMLDFGVGTATFTCSTQVAPYQRVHIMGTEGRVEIEVPFNAPAERPCIIWHERDGKRDRIALEVCDQYTVQGDLFSKAVLDNTAVPTPLTDAVANMRVIESLLESARSGRAVVPER